MLTAVVTGATGGLGLATAQGLAAAGHEVVLTGRSDAKGQAALDHVRRAVPQGQVRYAHLDVGSLDSVAAFAQAWAGPLDILVNNAGVMGYRTRRATVDGFEAQFGINYLGHFALTMRLLPALLAAAAPRVVNVASLAHRRGRIDFADLQGERGYAPFRAYSQSKLAMLMFGLELQRRADVAGWPLASITAHPGWSATQIVGNGAIAGPLSGIANAAFRLLGQSADAGAKPSLYAATNPVAKPGGYYGPAHLGETRGPVAPSKIMPQARNPVDNARLWDVSEQLTGTHPPA